MRLRGLLLCLAYRKALETYVKREDWYMWAQMSKGSITMPIFQSLDAWKALNPYGGHFHIQRIDTTQDSTFSGQGLCDMNLGRTYLFSLKYTASAAQLLIDGQLVVNPGLKYVQDKPVFPVSTISAPGAA